MCEIRKYSGLQNKLVEYRRELHRYPELSMKEYETTKRIRKWLTEEGIKILEYPIETGVIAEIQGEEPGPTIALRADIDAIPVKEATGLPFASENMGVMHACGHDFHTASMLGAAILLNKNKSKVKGAVRIIFQPGEESAIGSDTIVANGVLEGVKAILGLHNKPDLTVGTIGIKSGPLMASVDKFEIDVIGVGGHAGVPNNCIDPIIVGSQIVTSIQSIVSRSLSPFSDSVISITRFRAGTTWNVIPDMAELEGTVRTFNNKDREGIQVLMKRVCEGIAAGYGAKVDFRWHSSHVAVDNDKELSKIAKIAAHELGYTVVEAERTSGGEDFSLYQSIIPGLFVWIGVGGAREWHHPEYSLNEEALSIASHYFANLSISVLEKYS